MIDRFPTKLNSLSHINYFLNNEISTVIDIGILTSTIELMRVFKTQKHILVEPLEEYFEIINTNYSKAGIDYKLLKLAASNKKGTQTLKKVNHLPKLGEKYGGVTASNLIFDQNTVIDSNNSISVETDTLDNIKKNSKGPFLVKIDVDGAEFEILEGLQEVDDVYVIVVESWMSRICNLISIMTEKGFNLYDITDLCYMRGQLSQVDLIFVNKKLFNNENYPEITPRNFGHTPAISGNYVPFKEESIETKIERFQIIAKRGKID